MRGEREALTSAFRIMLRPKAPIQLTVRLSDEHTDQLALNVRLGLHSCLRLVWVSLTVQALCRSRAALLPRGAAKPAGSELGPGLQGQS